MPGEVALDRTLSLSLCVCVCVCVCEAMSLEASHLIISRPLWACVLSENAGKDLGVTGAVFLIHVQSVINANSDKPCEV